MSKRVHHVALVVRNMEEGFAFYRDKLGLPLLKTKRLEDQGVIAALLRLENAELELLQPLDETGGVARYLQRRGEGLHHVCFTSPDLPAELASLKERGVELVDEAPREGLAGSICFLHPRAHAGVLVELVDAPAGSDAASVPAQLADAGPPPGIRLAGVGVIATNLDAAVAAWRDVSGLAASRIVYDEREGAMAACLQVRDVEIDIKHPTHESSPLARELSVRGEGLLGLRLAADDLDKVIALLEVRGVQVGEPVGRLAVPRVALIDEIDSLGVPLEIGEASA